MSLSAHLVESHNRKPFLPPPAGYSTPFASRVGGGHDAGDMSWMSGHGFSMSQMPAPPRFTPWSEEKVAQLQSRLARKLGPEYVSQRPGPGGGPKLSYVEGWKVVNLANEVFGFNGWSSSIVSLTTDFCDTNEQGRTCCMITAIVRITLADGCYREDVGGGQADNIRGKAAAIDKAKKEAVTDGIKRTLRNFGNVLGMCLYDKEYTKEIAKMRVPAAKYTHGELERRPEFTDAGAAGPSRSGLSTTTAASTAASAVPQHMTNGHHKASMPPPAGRATVAPGSPLRSIAEPGSDDYGADGFDAEFIDPEFMDGLEESMMVDGTSLNPELSRADTSIVKPPAQQGQAVKNDQPIYQHRHRPDLPDKQLPQNRFAQAAALRQPPNDIANTSANGSASNVAGMSTRSGGSSGGSSGTVEIAHDATTKQAFGGSSNSNNLTSAGSSARRLAISSAMGKTPPPPQRPQQLNKHVPSGPVRAESPRIPSGGIDQVAARATTILRASGISLDFNQNTLVEPGYLGAKEEAELAAQEIKFGGFASARGMKRDISGEKLNLSPTKVQGAGGPGVQRTGPRMALGELDVGGDGGNWKRQRAV